MKLSVKLAGGVAALLLLAAVAVYLFVHEPRPVGAPGPAAEALADRMLAAVDAAAWDTTAYVAWDFDGRQQYRWRRDVDSVEVRWGDYVVDLHTETVTGLARRAGEPLTGEAAREALAAAWAYFCNDSFWLAAPFKVRDPGTTRSVVALEGGGEGLLVEYTSGGVTPGDAYLWELNAGGLPVAYRMWTSLVPVGGVRATWEGYVALPSGARVATRHALGPLTIEVEVE